jgi:hypothetical protein
MHSQSSPSAEDARRAWLQLVGCVIGLALLAVGLQDPRSLLRELTGAADLVTGDASLGSSAQAAILATAGLVVWVLLIWSVTVCAAAAVGRLPGTPGLIGRSLLRRIAPAAAGRLVAAAVGVSLLAGTSACAAPALASANSGSSADAASSESTSTASVPAGDGSGVVDPASAGSTITPTPPALTATDGVIASIVIDWPAAAGPAVSIQTPESTGPPAPSSTPESPSAAPSGTPLPPSDQTPISTDTGTSAASTPEQPPGVDGQPAPTSGSADLQEAPVRNDSGKAVPQQSADHAEPVVVRGGDSLWSIAASHLPPDSSDEDIDSAWRAWYFVNEQVIGENPDLIQPGQLLLPPTTK